MSHGRSGARSTRPVGLRAWPMLPSRLRMRATGARYADVRQAAFSNPPMHSDPHAIVVTGVSGSGKSTIASALAAHYGHVYLDADDFHTPDAKAAMAAGVPLDDAQRGPWVDRLVLELQRLAAQGRSAVLAFSGLRAAHRQRLRESGVPLRFVYLHAEPALIASRLAARSGHYMPASLLASQFNALQPPTLEPDVTTVQVDGAPEQVFERVLRALEGA